MTATTSAQSNLETPAPEMDQLSADRTAVPSPANSQEEPPAATPDPVAMETAAALAPTAPAEPVYEAGPDDIRHYAPIEPVRTADSAQGMTGIRKTQSGRQITNDDIFKILSKRRTNNSGRKGSVAGDDPAEDHAERAEIERLMSRMFGRDRQANSEEEQTRHVGLSFKNLTVTGMGLGAALQPTVGDIIMGVPRLIRNLIKGGPKRIAAGKPPVRTLLNDFNGCVRPGEMLLVLGRPGAGCSTFLKVLGNQRFGYVDVAGEVTYGGTSAAEMAKNYRGEVLYNPEDDLHYATLSVQKTLTFALKTRTPGKASRAEGETRADYVREFLRVVAKLFWIEHTMSTKVGNEFVRGVSGGEKKR